MAFVQGLLLPETVSSFNQVQRMKQHLKPGNPGTYFYRASASDKIDFFGLVLPYFTDSQLSALSLLIPLVKNRIRKNGS
jgi:hypothetical protein